MVAEQVRRGRVWKRRLAAFFGSAVLLAGLAGAASVGPRLLRPNAYASVTSIETRPDFHDPALLARAWALPVAAAYRRRPYEYQNNPSFCGPATVANLLRSLGVDQFAGYLQHDNKEETLRVYGETVIPALSDHLTAKA